MKNYIFLLSLFISGILFSQSKEELEVQTTIENMFQSIYSELNESEIQTFFTSDFVLFENGEIKDYSFISQVIDNLKVQFQNEENKDSNLQRINSFEFLKTYIYNDVAWIYYKTSAIFKLNDTEIANMKWLQSANLKKENGKWKFQHLHSSIQK